MSFFTENSRADLAVSRSMLINHQDKDSSGNKRFQVLPWEVVVYGGAIGSPGGIGGFEPTSSMRVNGIGTGTLELDDSDRHPTDIMFVSGDTFMHSDGPSGLCGGDIGFPRR